jgi:hypothetical protein
MANAYRDENSVPTLIAASSADGSTPIRVWADPTTHRLLVDLVSGSGTVTSVSVVSANGFAGTVATATTTPAITISTTINAPVLAGNGTAISAATTTGTGSTVVLQGTPTLTTPVIGAATGTSLTVTGLLASATGLTLEETGAGTDIITIQAPASIAASYTLTLPINDGAASEFLQTDGNGVLSWAAGSSGITVGTTTITSGTTTRILYDNAGVLGEYTLTGTGTVVAMATAPTFVTSIATPSVLATANDSGALGASGTAFADLFLASGGVINWSAADATITHSAGLLTVNVPLTSSGLMTATGFAPTASTATGNRLYLPAANTLGFAINGSGEVQLDASALSPISNAGNALGTTALGWNGVNLSTGTAINWANGEVTITETDANTLTVAGASVVTLGTSAAFTTGTIELGAASDTTIARVSAGVVSIEGITIDTISAANTLTNKTLTAPILGGATSLADGATIKLILPTVDGTATGPTTAAFVSGYTSSAIGDLVYLDTSSKWQKTDADALATTTGILGIALAVAATDAALLVALPGSIVYATAFPTLTIGAPYYVGETAGAIQATIPTGADNAVRVVGFGVHADKLFFNPSSDTSTTVA